MRESGSLRSSQSPGWVCYWSRGPDLVFDERLTVGFNPYLAEALNLGGLELLGEKQGRILGMVGAGAGPARPSTAPGSVHR